MFGFKKPDAEKADGVEPFEGIDPQTGAVVTASSDEERKFVRRLDMFLLTFGCISQVIKYLDLNMYGNEYNYFTTYFSVGYAVFLLPSQIAITWFRPSIWLPCLEIGWGVMTGLIAMTTNVKQVYALRTFLGVMESSAYPGTVTLLMAWYTPHELALRISFYHSCQAIGSMMSNALQSAIHSTLEGKAGLEGWRWLFVINAIMTVVLGLCGFFMIPDYPTRPNQWSFWFTKRHAELAVARTERYRRAATKRFTWASIKRAVRTPLFYGIPALYVATVLAQAGYSYFNLWLKSLTNADGTKRWTTNEVLVIPIGGNAIAVVLVWVCGWISDRLQTRYLVVLAQAVIGLIPAIIMSVWNVSDAAKYTSYFLSFTVLCTAPPIFAWLSDLLPHDAEVRAFTLGWAIAVYYAISSWSQVLIWPAKEAPHYTYGWKVSIGLWLFVIVMLFALRWAEIKIIRPYNRRIVAEQDAATVGEPVGVQSGDGKTGKDEKMGEEVNVLVRSRSS